MAARLRWTGVPQAISGYRFVTFNLPRLTTAAAVMALAGIGTIRIHHLAVGYADTLGSSFYFGLTIVAVVLACGFMVYRRRYRVVQLGWGMGGLVATATIAVYVVSRTVGVPGFAGLVQWWNYPLGTFLMLIAAGYLALHFSVLTGMNVAYPCRRRWRD